MSMYRRIIRWSCGSLTLASMALSKRLPNRTQRSRSEIDSLTGMRASARTGTPLERASEILLFKMASAMVLPVFTAGSTRLRSCSSSVR